MKHDYHNNNNIRLLMTFEYRFKIFRIRMARRKHESIRITVEQYSGKKTAVKIR